MLNIRIGNGAFPEYPYDQVGVFNWIITSSIECFHMRSNTVYVHFVLWLLVSPTIFIFCHIFTNIFFKQFDHTSLQ